MIERLPLEQFDNLNGFLRVNPSFQKLDKDSLQELDRELERVYLRQDEVLFHQGDPGDGMYVLLQGVLSVDLAGPSGEEAGIDVLEPGACVGELALLTGQPRSATVRGLVDAELVCLSKAGFERLMEKHPAALEEFSRELLPRIQRPQLAAVLYQLFGPVEAATIHDLQKTVTWRRLFAGETLFQQGDPGNAMYIVMNGRLKIVASDETGRLLLTGEAGRGEIVGEFALLTGQPRSATVVAIRDSEVVELSKALFDSLLEKYPQGMLAIARMIIGRASSIAAHRQARGSSTNATFALLPASAGIPLAEFAGSLAAVLEPSGSTLVLTGERFDDLYGKKRVSQTTLDAPTSLTVSSWLSEQENHYRYILYLAEPVDSAWTRRCLSQADRILIVADATADPVPGPLEIELEMQKKDVRAELVLIQPDAMTRPSATRRWLEPRAIHTHHHLRMNFAEDFACLARRLTGKATGIVYSGGGARGFAHAGVIRAFEEASISIDMIGGTSMGALVGGLTAAGFNYHQIHGIARDFASPKKLLDYTLPYAGLVSSAKVTSMLRHVFGDLQIEDLWRPFFCMSSDLTRAEPLIHDRGPLWAAIRASTAIPGIFTPLLVDHRVLVDGGVMNIFPVDIMRQWVEDGPVIGVNASIKQDKLSNYDFGPSINGWQVMLSKINPLARKQKAPSIFTSLWRATEINSVYHRKTQEALCDLLICPPVEQYGSLDFGAFEEIITAGYEAAIDEIARWKSAMNLTLQYRIDHP